MIEILCLTKHDRALKYLTYYLGKTITFSSKPTAKTQGVLCDFNRLAEVERTIAHQSIHIICIADKDEVERLPKDAGVTAIVLVPFNYQDVMLKIVDLFADQVENVHIPRTIGQVLAPDNDLRGVALRPHLQAFLYKNQNVILDYEEIAARVFRVNLTRRLKTKIRRSCIYLREKRQMDIRLRCGRIEFVCDEAIVGRKSA